MPTKTMPTKTTPAKASPAKASPAKASPAKASPAKTVPAKATQVKTTPTKAVRNLVIVLGDQLDANSAAFDGFDPSVDALWMAEVVHESNKVWSGKPRIALFLSAMRHFCAERRAAGWSVYYRELTNEAACWRGADGRQVASNGDTFAAVLGASLASIRPERVLMVEPGEWQVRREIVDAIHASGVPLELFEDRHFLCTHAEFAAHAQGRKQLRMEYFYRELRVRHSVLMVAPTKPSKAAAQPEGGSWNFDHDNRKSFGAAGPPSMPAPITFAPDEITQAVLTLVDSRFASHPGDLQAFDWPVTAAQAELALDDFIAHRLPEFGDWQDAMWTNQPWLFHSRLSAAMNLKLINPRRVIAAAEQAWRNGQAPLPAVEGFIRQILGWREYVRGIYWQQMPNYLNLNALNATQNLPDFYWTGNTEMACLRDALGQTLRFGYAHHIQRLMVTGLYALMFGVQPQQVHAWYLAVYVDAIEWVELPNTLGMSQYADGGLMASKPYIATGKYIQRMSNYCAGCRYDPSESTGAKACPFTTLYWDFLIQHEAPLRKNQRMLMQLRNLDRLDAARRAEIQTQAAALRVGGKVGDASG
jgi:deoxyribodipyrimidine photolyase-related protein